MAATDCSAASEEFATPHHHGSGVGSGWMVRAAFAAKPAAGEGPPTLPLRWPSVRWDPAKTWQSLLWPGSHLAPEVLNLALTDLRLARSRRGGPSPRIGFGSDDALPAPRFASILTATSPGLMVLANPPAPRPSPSPAAVLGVPETAPLSMASTAGGIPIFRSAHAAM